MDESKKDLASARSLDAALKEHELQKAELVKQLEAAHATSTRLEHEKLDLQTQLTDAHEKFKRLEIDYLDLQHKLAPGTTPITPVITPGTGASVGLQAVVEESSTLACAGDILEFRARLVGEADPALGTPSIVWRVVPAASAPKPVVPKEPVRLAAPQVRSIPDTSPPAAVLDGGAPETRAAAPCLETKVKVAIPSALVPLAVPGEEEPAAAPRITPMTLTVANPLEGHLHVSPQDPFVLRIDTEGLEEGTSYSVLAEIIYE